MKGLNKVTLIGNIGKDPEFKMLDGNVKVGKFTFATSDTFKDDKGQSQTITDWHNIVVWRGLADLIEKYAAKGSSLYIEGKLKTRSFEDKENVKRYVTEIVADNIILLDKKTLD